jgi:hypothetical protein
MQFIELIGQINKGGKQTLNANQIEAARQIYNQSIANNIDPRLTLSMAWQESTLGNATPRGDLKRGADYALGTMQVLRSTAKGMGMEKEWLEADKAIKSGSRRFDLEAAMGVNYTKTLIRDSGANNIADVAAGYNGGPSKIGKNYGKAQEYVQKVSSHMGKFFGGGQKIDWKSPVTPNGMAYAPAGDMGYKAEVAKPSQTGVNYQPEVSQPSVGLPAQGAQTIGDLQAASADWLSQFNSTNNGVGNSYKDSLAGLDNKDDGYNRFTEMLQKRPVTEPLPQEAPEYLAPLQYVSEDPKVAMTNILTQEYNDMYEI